MPRSDERPNRRKRGAGGKTWLDRLRSAAGSLPFNRENSGPTLAYSWVQPRYIKETYIEGMERIEDFNHAHRESYQLAVSIGMARHDGEDRVRLEDLLTQADAAMYEEKRGKRKAVLR